MKVHVEPKRIHLRIQTDCRYELAKYELRDAKVIQQAGKWYIFHCIEKETEQPKLVTSVLAIDFGVRHITLHRHATTAILETKLQERPQGCLCPGTADWMQTPTIMAARISCNELFGLLSRVGAH